MSSAKSLYLGGFRIFALSLSFRFSFSGCLLSFRLFGKSCSSSGSGSWSAISSCRSFSCWFCSISFCSFCCLSSSSSSFSESSGSWDKVISFFVSYSITTSVFSGRNFISLCISILFSVAKHPKTFSVLVIAYENSFFRFGVPFCPFLLGHMREDFGSKYLIFELVCSPIVP